MKSMQVVTHNHEYWDGYMSFSNQIAPDGLSAHLNIKCNNNCDYHNSLGRSVFKFYYIHYLNQNGLRGSVIFSPL